MSKSRAARPAVPAAPPARSANPGWFATFAKLATFAARVAAAAAAAAAVAAVAAAIATAAPPGTVSRVEVTGVTRQVAAVWIRATVPAPPAQTSPELLVFHGTISAGDVVLPVRGPVGVTLQRRTADGPAEAVFSPDVELARLPQGILALAGSPSFPFVLRGSIRAAGGPGAGTGAPILA